LARLKFFSFPLAPSLKSLPITGLGHEIRSNNGHGKIETKVVQYPHCQNLPNGYLCKSSVQPPAIFHFYETGEMP